MKIAVLLSVLFFVFCSQEINENLFDYNLTEEDLVVANPYCSVSVSVDSAEVLELVYLNLVAEEMDIDSIWIDVEGDSVVDKVISTYIKIYPVLFYESGTYSIVITFFSGENFYQRSVPVTVVPKWFGIIDDTVDVDTTDIIINYFVEDSTLSVGSAPIIAFLGENDTLFVSVYDSFVDPGAIIYDQEDGIIGDYISVYDSLLLLLPDSTFVADTCSISVTAEDSHGNISQRLRYVVLSNDTLGVE